MKSEYVYKIKGDLRRNEKMEDGEWIHIQNTRR